MKIGAPTLILLVGPGAGDRATCGPGAALAQGSLAPLWNSVSGRPRAGRARVARLSRARHDHTPGGCRASPGRSGARGPRGDTSPSATALATHGGDRGPSRPGPGGGSGGRGAEPRARGGAGRAGASRSEEVPAPRFGEVRPGACAQHPAPGRRAAGPRTSEPGGRAAESLAVSARRWRRDRYCPCGQGCAGGSGLRFRTPRTPAAGSTWTPGRRGTGVHPHARGGGGAATGFPFSAAQSPGK